MLGGRSLKSRFDPQKIANLLALPLPRPIHALNLVHVRDVNCYRLYGLLLAPYAMSRGARPVWAAALDEPVLGPEPADEIVVVSYPDQRALVDIIASRYYSWVNRLRVRGVNRLGFALTEPAGGGIARGNGCCRLAVLTDDPALPGRIAQLAAPHLTTCYSSELRSSVALFRDSEPGDPEPIAPRHFALLDDSPTGAGRRRLRSAADELRRIAVSATLHWYRAIGLTEALPWVASSQWT